MKDDNKLDLLKYSLFFNSVLHPKLCSLLTKNESFIQAKMKPTRKRLEQFQLFSHPKELKLMKICGHKYVKKIE